MQFAHIGRRLYYPSNKNRLINVWVGGAIPAQLVLRKWYRRTEWRHAIIIITLKKTNYIFVCSVYILYYTCTYFRPNNFTLYNYLSTLWHSATEQFSTDILILILLAFVFRDNSTTNLSADLPMLRYLSLKMLSRPQVFKIQIYFSVFFTSFPLLQIVIHFLTRMSQPLVFLIKRIRIWLPSLVWQPQKSIRKLERQ